KQQQHLGKDECHGSLPNQKPRRKISAPKSRRAGIQNSENRSSKFSKALVSISDFSIASMLRYTERRVSSSSATKKVPPVMSAISRNRGSSIPAEMGYKRRPKIGSCTSRIAVRFEP